MARVGACQARTRKLPPTIWRKDQVPSVAVVVRADANPLGENRSISTVAPPTGPLGPVTVPLRAAVPRPIEGATLVVTPTSPGSVRLANPGGSVLGGGGRGTVVPGGGND